MRILTNEELDRLEEKYAEYLAECQDLTAMTTDFQAKIVASRMHITRALDRYVQYAESIGATIEPVASEPLTIVLTA